MAMFGGVVRVGKNSYYIPDHVTMSLKDNGINKTLSAVTLTSTTLADGQDKITLKANKAGFLDLLFCNQKQRRQMRYENFKAEWEKQYPSLNFKEHVKLKKDGILSFAEAQSLSIDKTIISTGFDDSDWRFFEKKAKEIDPKADLTRYEKDANGKSFQNREKMFGICVDFLANSNLKPKDREYLLATQKVLLLSYKDTFLDTMKQEGASGLNKQLLTEYQGLFCDEKGNLRTDVKPEHEMLYLSTRLLERLGPNEIPGIQKICKTALVHFMPLPQGVTKITHENFSSVLEAWNKNKGLLDFANVGMADLLFSRAYKIDDTFRNELLACDFLKCGKLKDLKNETLALAGEPSFLRGTIPTNNVAAISMKQFLIDLLIYRVRQELSSNGENPPIPLPKNDTEIISTGKFFLQNIAKFSESFKVFLRNLMEKERLELNDAPQKANNLCFISSRVIFIASELAGFGSDFVWGKRATLEANQAMGQKKDLMDQKEKTTASLLLAVAASIDRLFPKENGGYDIDTRDQFVAGFYAALLGHAAEPKKVDEEGGVPQGVEGGDQVVKEVDLDPVLLAAGGPVNPPPVPPAPAGGGAGLGNPEYFNEKINEWLNDPGLVFGGEQYTIPQNASPVQRVQVLQARCNRIDELLDENDQVVSENFTFSKEESAQVKKELLAIQGECNAFFSQYFDFQNDFKAHSFTLSLGKYIVTKKQTNEYIDLKGPTLIDLRTQEAIDFFNQKLDEISPRGKNEPQVSLEAAPMALSRRCEQMKAKIKDPLQKAYVEALEEAVDTYMWNVKPATD